MEKEKLVELAFLASENAYAPYSHFKVGACVELKNGHYVQGCNIENAAYGSTMCAERNAVYGAYCQGYKKEDIVALKGINNITLSSPRADVYLYTSSNKELKVVQYSRSKVEEKKKFHSFISGDDLNISNNIDDVMAGISYEIFVFFIRNI